MRDDDLKDLFVMQRQQDAGRTPAAMPMLEQALASRRRHALRMPVSMAMAAAAVLAVTLFLFRSAVPEPESDLQRFLHRCDDFASMQTGLQSSADGAGSGDLFTWHASTDPWMD